MSYDGGKTMLFDELTEEQKRSCYESYVGDCRYENGDNAKHYSYEEWCKESEEIGEPYGVCI